jgi:hypothetical protein
MFFLGVFLSKELQLDELLQRSSPWHSLKYHLDYLQTREEDTQYFVCILFWCFPFSFCFVFLFN